MTDTVKITGLHIEKVKRVNVVDLCISESGLTLIGGDNGQGKTSILDSIVYALGGEKYRPSDLKNEGTEMDPYIKINLNNGLIIERKGKNSALKVTDPSGKASGQKLLDQFVEQFALDIGTFIHADNKDKARIMLKALGLAETLQAIDLKETEVYTNRTLVGRQRDTQTAYVTSITNPEVLAAPDTELSAADILKAYNESVAYNEETDRLIMEADLKSGGNAVYYATNVEAKEAQITQLEKQILVLRDDASRAREIHAGLVKQEQDLRAKAAMRERKDVSTMQGDIERVTKTNSLVAKKKQLLSAIASKQQYEAQYTDLTTKLEEVRASKLKLLESAAFPLEGLTVQDNALLYKGKHWDCMSGSEQLRVAAAIVKKINPRCGFIIMDGLEQFDLKTLADFNAWLISQGLQAIATRVSKGDECSIIIEDGTVKT